jgi:hypothetical protein
MATQTSTFSEWLYTRPAFGRTGRSLSENNFAKERRGWVAILLREILQNGLDARLGEEKVVVKIGERLLSDDDAEFVSTLIPAEHLQRFKESLPHINEVPASIRRFLIVEDFGTAGLTGSTEDPSLDGKGQNWNAFWFREGEGGKEHGAGNGGAGQGKITYFSTSSIRTIFAYTVRSDDKRQALYGASSFMREYSFGGEKWLRDSYWGIHAKRKDSLIAIPSEKEDAVQSFREVLGISRNSQQPGLSLIIPSPRDFSIEEAVEVTIAEFFTPILRGDLVVEIGDLTLDKDSIEEIADSRLSDNRARELHTCTTKGYRNFVRQALLKSKDDQVTVMPQVDAIAKISESSFDPDVFEKLKNDLADGEQIGLRLPVVVKPKHGENLQCYFDIHLMCPEELDEPEQAIVRRDLLIGEEPIGGGKLRQRARGFTLITDKELSKLLLSAEEATHLRWNTRLPRLKEYYKYGPDVIAIVRNAMAKVLDVLSGAAQQRDFKALAKYFPAPGTLSQTKSRGKKSNKGSEPPLNGVIPPAIPKKLLLKSLDDGCRVLANNSHPLELSDLPVWTKIEFAYEGLDKDAFAEYDPLDFDLDDPDFSVMQKNCLVVDKSQNSIEFEITDVDFEFQLTGFDKNLRLRMRLNYKEASDATAVDTE